MKLKPTTAAPVLLIVVFLLTAAFKLMPTEAIGAEENPYLLAVIIQLVIFALPAILFCTLRGGDYNSELRLRFPKPPTILLMVGALLMMVCGGSVIDYFMSMVAPESMASSSATEYAGFAMNAGVFDGLYLVLTFAILPAVTEEFLFRGIVLNEYSKLSISCSVIMSAVCFAMCHFSIARLPSCFFCGIVLGLLTYATRSIAASMIVHALYNTVVLFFEEFILHVASKNNVSGILFVIICAAITLAAAAFSAFEASSIYRSYALENVPSDYVPKKKNGFFSSLISAVFTPAFLILIVAYVLMTLIM